MPAGGLLVGGIAALGSAAIGASAAANSQTSAENADLNAVQQYLALHVPDPAEQQLILQRYKQTGQMDPRLATAFQQAKSNMASVTTDPALEDAQMSALSSLQNEAENGGHTLEQDAYVNKNQQQVNAENHGREGAIEQQFAERGMGQPGGLALQAQEMNNQNMTQQENDASMKAAEDAQHNALQSLQGEGQLAGQVRSQDWNQKASVAQAQDSINQFNTQMNQGVENANVAAQNQAQSYNVQEGQKIADQNTNVANAEQQYNKALPQQQYEDQVQKAGGAASAYENQAGQFQQAGKTNADMWGNIGQGALKTGVGVGQVYGNSKTSGTPAATSGSPTTSGTNAGETYDDSTWG